MVIDAHVHVGKTEKSRRYFGFEGLSNYLDKTGVDKAVVMPNLSNESTLSDLNKQFMSMACRELQRYYSFILIDPFDKETLLQAQLMSDIFGLKYHPSFCQYEVDRIKLEPFFEVAAERKLPVLVHCGRNEKSSFDYLFNAAASYPGVEFIAAHLGGNATELSEAAIDLLHRREDVRNISLDTSNSKLPWLIALAVDRLGAERVIFGSDEPYASLEIEKMCVKLADLSVEESSLVYSENIRRILRCEGDG